jgi:branched-chain amino acid transport system substrate-binding protein
VQECMISSTCKRQVVILDCCHSGAFSQQNLPMGGSNVDVSGAIKQALDALDPVNPTARFTLPSDRAQNPLGREGRAVLTSSTSLEYSFERLTQNDASKLSVYTRYLIEGLETGVADTDEDGNISAYGLHEYAKRKVKDEFPDMTPQFFAHREGHGILLARSKPKDRRFKYQKAVEDIVRENADKAVEWGRLPDAANSVLLDILEHLNEERLDGPILSLEEATEIQATVLKPLLRLHKKLQRYRNRFVEFLTHEQQYPLKDADRVRLLQTLQGELGLRAVDTNRIEKEAVLHLYHQKLDERLGMLK